MSERATIASQSRDALKLKHQVAAHAQNTAAYFSTDSFDGTSIHRKASCACGGGCQACQAKSNDLKVSQPNDPAEIEADQIADRVMRMPADTPIEVSHHSPDPDKLNAKCDACEEEKPEETVLRKEGNVAAAVDPPPDDGMASVKSVINSGGHPLDRESRSFFEPRFGTDLSHVRIHTDSIAGQSARAINARAFTAGRDVVFDEGQYQQGTDAGRRLLAHELAHVVQQEANHSLSIQRRTYRDTFTTVAFLSGPLWDVRLTIIHAPEDETERLDAFIDACHDGIMNAVRSLGERPSVTTRDIQVRIRFSARSSDAISEEAFDLAIASLPRARLPVGETRPADTRPSTLHIPHDPSEDTRPGETDDQRIRRQASASLRQLSNVVADAGSEGYNRVVLNIQNNGREIIPGFSKELQTTNQSSTDRTSAFGVRDILGVYFDIFTQGSGRWQIIFTRQGNAMSFSSFQSITEPPPRTATSEEEELRALGIPNRREIYAHIFQETEHQLQEAGVMIAGFAIEQLVLWVAGGVLFRGLGLVGRAAFPRIMALVARGTPAALASGLDVLSTTERVEFGVLMQRVETGALNAAERSRLSGLLTRIEAALPSSTAAAELMGSIRLPRVARLVGSSGRLDAEMLRRAAEIRATQAGLSLEAFTNYNVAVARVRTASGEIVYLEGGNLPGAAHSEEYILAQLRERANGLMGARVEQLYSERIPCSNCSDVIKRYFGEGVDVFYSVGNQRDRGRILMEAYGL